MGLFVLGLYRRVRDWPVGNDGLRDVGQFLAMDGSWLVVLDLLGVAMAGGMFVVPLYAFLTPRAEAETARTIAAQISQFG